MMIINILYMESTNSGNLHPDCEEKLNIPSQNSN